MIVSKRLQANVDINKGSNVELQKIDLSDHDAELPYYLPETDNFSMGTFSTAEQYDFPLVKIGELSVRSGFLSF